MPVQKLIDALVTGGVASVGGIAYYLYKISGGEHFKSHMFFIHAFLSFVIGGVAGEFIPNEASYKFGLATAVGFFAIEIIKIGERRLPLLLNKYLDKGLPK